MLGGWFEILCPHINFVDYYNNLLTKKIITHEQHSDRMYFCKLREKLINSHMDNLNSIDGKERKFKIIIEEF
jgi:hypothetical protein